MGGEEVEQLAARVVALDHGVTNVGPVEAGNEDARGFQPEADDDFAPRQLIRRGGQGDARNLRIALVQDRELDVFRAEIVAPLRDAMRFVNGAQGQLAIGIQPVEQGEETRGQQAFRGDVNQIQFARQQAAFDR